MNSGELIANALKVFNIINPEKHQVRLDRRLPGTQNIIIPDLERELHLESVLKYPGKNVKLPRCKCFFTQIVKFPRFHVKDTRYKKPNIPGEM